MEIFSPAFVTASMQSSLFVDLICFRTRMMFSQLGYEDYNAVNIQILGSEETYGPHAKRNIDGVSNTHFIDQSAYLFPFAFA